MEEHYKKQIYDAFYLETYEYLDQLILQVLDSNISVYFEFNQGQPRRIEKEFIIYLVEKGARYYLLNNHAYVGFNLYSSDLTDITSEVHYWNGDFREF